MIPVLIIQTCATVARLFGRFLGCGPRNGELEGARGIEAEYGWVEMEDGGETVKGETLMNVGLWSPKPVLLRLGAYDGWR